GAAIMLAPFSGTRLIDDAEYLYRGEGENSWAGSSVSSAGDVDADGLADVIIGADNTCVDGEYRGKVYLLYGADL
ncbi:FG-GAP repeat protein, partial [bacterium]|nr:FG-GAP repeat protein [bacterium]